MPKRKPTPPIKVEPFKISGYEKSKKAEQELEEKKRKILEEEEEMKQFKARKMPTFQKPIKIKNKKSIEVKPFNLKSEERRLAYEA